MANKEATLLIKIKQMGAESLKTIGDGLESIGKLATAAFGTLSGLVIASIKAYGDQEKATNSLNQSLVTQGIYTADLSKKYTELAAALQKKSTFADEEIIQAQSTLQSYLGQTQVTEGVVKATLDLAAAKGIDLNSAAQLVGKSIGTETNALAKQGIQLSDGASKTERLAEVVGKLSSKFGGQAEAQTKGVGSLIVMKNQMGEVLELIGERLAPVVVILAQYFTDFTSKIESNKSSFDGLVSVSKLFVKGIIIGFSEVINIASSLGAMFGTLFGALAQAASGQFKMAWETLKSGNEEANAEAIQRAKETDAVLASIDAASSERNARKAEAELELLNAQSQAKKDQAALDDEFFAMKSEEELVKMQMQFDMQNNMEAQNRIKQLNDEALHATTREAQIAAHYKKRQAMTQAMYDAELKLAVQNGDLMAVLNSKRVQDFDNTMSNLSKLQNSKNKEMVAIGKAAAIAHIAIDTARGAIAAYSSLAVIPIVGPALGAVAAAALVAYGAEQIGRVNSAHMAEGGIVKSTPGGINAVIGEGGRDEAVIPLPDEGGLLGSTIIINVTGLMGDANSAREFAIVVDRELLNLRRSNQSQAFESGVI